MADRHQGRVREAGNGFSLQCIRSHVSGLLESIECGAYKIASPELVDVPLIEYTASKGKPMIISCGMGSMEEIQDAVDACRREGNEQIVLLKCTSEYPAVYEDMNIATMADMRERFGFPVGLSDHSMAMRWTLQPPLWVQA